MTNNLEFHYVVSYRDGMGWEIAADVESAIFPDGTIYDWNDGEWTFPSGTTTGQAIESLDLAHYTVLKSFLRKMNGEE